MAPPASRCSPPRPTAGTTSGSPGRRSRATSASTRSACASLTATACRPTSVDLYVYAGAARAAALPASGVLGEGLSKPLSPADQARIALRARDVVLVRPPGDARVFARRATVRRGLAARAGGTALAVTCPLRCRVDARVKGSGRSAPLARTTARPGHAARLRLS